MRRCRLSPLSVRGKPPVSTLSVTQEDPFLHCGRALIRSRLWEQEAHIDRSRSPTYGQVLADKIAGAGPEQIDASEDQANRNQLY